MHQPGPPRPRARPARHWGRPARYRRDHRGADPRRRHLHGVHRDPPAIWQPAGQRRRRQRLHARHRDHRYRHRQPRSLHAEPAGGRPDPAAYPAGTGLPVPAGSPRLLRGQPGRPAQPRHRRPGPPAAPDLAASLPAPARGSRPRGHRAGRGQPPAPHARRASNDTGPAASGAGAVRQPRIPGGQQYCPHRHRPRQHSRRQVTRARSPPRSQRHERHPRMPQGKGRNEPARLRA